MAHDADSCGLFNLWLSFSQKLNSPQYRLRVDEWRVFYDVGRGEVFIRGVVKKSDAGSGLAQFGVTP